MVPRTSVISCSSACNNSSPVLDQTSVGLLVSRLTSFRVLTFWSMLSSSATTEATLLVVCVSELLLPEKVGEGARRQ